MSYDTFTVFSEIPVALSPKELETKIDSMLAPEINALIKSWDSEGANDQSELSSFAASLLDGALCFLEDDEPDEGTPDQIKETLADYYTITAGSTPNSSLINLWAWSEAEDACYTDTIDHLETFFLPLLDGDYILGGYAHENSKRGGDGGSYVLTKEGKVIQMKELVEFYFSHNKEC